MSRPAVVHTTPDGEPIYGVMAEYADPAALTQAAEKFRDAGFQKWDVYSPFPVHGMDEAMGLKASKVGPIVGIGAIIGAGGGLLLQGYLSAINYRIVVAGKPFFAWEQFMPITFELGVLISAFGAIFGMLALNRLPRLHHPLMKKERFLRVSDDRFMIVVEADDPQFEPVATRSFFENTGASNIDVVEA